MRAARDAGRRVKRLVLVRHGESLWNAEGRIQGQQCAGLSDIGRTQAEVTARVLAVAYPAAELVASDLQRTMETARPLAEALGREAVPNPGLRERHFGIWEGRLRSEVTNGDAARWERWLTGEDVINEVGGESAEQLGDRVDPVLRQLLAVTSESGVMVAVTHGGPVWHGTHRLLGLSVPTLGGVSNASITEFLQIPDGRILLDRWNQVAHLPLDLRATWRPSVTASDAPPVGR